MTNRAETAIEQLRYLTACRCDVIWTSRDMHAPDCNYEYRDYVDILAGCCQECGCGPGFRLTDGRCDGCHEALGLGATP